MFYRIREYLGHLSDPIPKLDSPSSSPTLLTHTWDKHWERPWCHQSTLASLNVPLHQPEICLQDVTSDSPSFCFGSYGIGCPSETLITMFPLPSRFSNSPFCHPGTLLSSSPKNSLLLPPKSDTSGLSWNVSSMGQPCRTELSRMPSYHSGWAAVCHLPLLYHLSSLKTHAQREPRSCLLL